MPQTYEKRETYEKRADGNGGGQGVAVAVGAGTGALLGTLLGQSRKAEAAAPEVDERLDQMLVLLAAIKAANDKIVRLLEGLAFPALVTEPWKTLDPVLVFDQDIRAAVAVFGDIMVDCSHSKRVLVKFESSLDQAANIQPIGNHVQSLIHTTNIGAVIPVPANTNRSVGLAFDDWQPFVGVVITPPAPPTTGNLKVWIVRQE